MANKKKSKKRMKSKPAARKRTKAAPKKSVAKKQAAKKTAAKKTAAKRSKGRPSRPESNRIYTHKEGVTFEPERAGLRAGGQSGDLQALPDVEGADSESVDELLEEGNAFEADAVAGVEHAEDEREVHTHEVPEDDVPEEYRDKDS